MNKGATVFGQILSYANYDVFRRSVRKYDGDRGVRRLSCWEQFLALVFAQLTHRESLRDLEVSLNAHGRQLYHCGFRSPAKRSTLADANESRDWRIFSEYPDRIDITISHVVFLCERCSRNQRNRSVSASVSTYR